MTSTVATSHNLMVHHLCPLKRARSHRAKMLPDTFHALQDRDSFVRRRRPQQNRVLHHLAPLPKPRSIPGKRYGCATTAMPFERGDNFTRRHVPQLHRIITICGRRALFPSCENATERDISTPCHTGSPRMAMLWLVITSNSVSVRVDRMPTARSGCCLAQEPAVLPSGENATEVTSPGGFRQAKDGSDFVLAFLRWPETEGIILRSLKPVVYHPAINATELISNPPA